MRLTCRMEPTYTMVQTHHIHIQLLFRKYPPPILMPEVVGQDGRLYSSSPKFFNHGNHLIHWLQFSNVCQFMHKLCKLFSGYFHTSVSQIVTCKWLTKSLNGNLPSFQFCKGTFIP